MGTVLIIGASRGIGHELALQYLQAGQRVIATARDESALQALRDMGAQPLRLGGRCRQHQRLGLAAGWRAH